VIGRFSMIIEDVGIESFYDPLLLPFSILDLAASFCINALILSFLFFIANKIYFKVKQKKEKERKEEKVEVL